MALSATMRATSVVAGNGAGGRVEQRFGVGQLADGAPSDRRALGGSAGHRWSNRTRPRSAGPLRASALPWCATTVPRRSAPRTRQLPCGCHAGGAGLDHGSVVLGHRGKGGLDVPGSRHDHRRQAIGPPHPWCAAQPPEHLVDGTIRWGWSIFSANTPRTLPECGRVPSST